VAPGKGIEVGYHKGNKKHGLMLKIMQTGKKEIKMYKDGMRHGPSVKFKPDGTKKTYIYDNDQLVKEE
jgi:antitoxin component YwqK of YwqJK toxin-antitoxin module